METCLLVLVCFNFFYLDKSKQVANGSTNTAATVCLANTDLKNIACANILCKSQHLLTIEQAQYCH